FFTLLFSLMVIVFYWILPIDLTDSFQLNFIFRNILVSSLIGAATLRYFYLQLQYRKQLTLQTSAKLDALQARIRPHFLFNSMNVIASLTQIDADKAESAIEDLSDLFRVTLDNAQEMIPFQQELDNAKKYLSLEQLRLGERLVINESIDKQSLSVLIPPLSLQPLLENAVYHGIQPLPEGGEVDLKAIIENGKLLVSVSNPKSTQKDHHGAGIALSNISERLDMLYKGKASLQVEETDKQYQVTMKVPVTV
ncbi:MAG: histidine kinase, partial [Gammaproteobacteria bacterium]|nr:histidine kinase [Gammaproteobacteria bacterium]